MKLRIIDSHTHCGIQDYPGQSYEDYYRLASQTDITGVVMFPPVSEIYDRWDPNFKDTPEWKDKRKRANEYLLTLKNRELEVIPYFFIWNDFAVDQLKPDHKGIKWHRHPDEPPYHYKDPRCKLALDIIRKKNLPVVLEEELRNTLMFVKELANGIRVIIPHLGMLNGGFRALLDSGIFEMPNVYVDTSLAAKEEVIMYIQKFGPNRIFFGSDFPFGDPRVELDKIHQLNLSIDEKASILGNNLLTLLSEVNFNESI